jgi:hypothetical protein
MNFVETVREILRREGMLGTTKGAGDHEGPRERQPSVPTATTSRPIFAPGCWIEWDSPLFGLLTGQVLDADDTHILVWHKKAEGLRNIPVNWVTRTLTDPKRGLS